MRPSQAMQMTAFHMPLNEASSYKLCRCTHPMRRVMSAQPFITICEQRSIWVPWNVDTSQVHCAPMVSRSATVRVIAS